METVLEMIPLALILCFGIFVQASAGFAAGLIIIPSLLWIGYSIPEAQASMLVATIPQNCWGVWSLRDSISRRRVTWPGLTRVAFLPVGCGVLWLLQSQPIDRVKQAVGAMVLLVTIAIIFFNPKQREHLSPVWTWITFPISGFLQGLVGMGGPPMVFWVQAHDWSTRQVRGFLFAMYLISIVPALTVLYLYFGNLIFRPMLTAAATIPLLLLVTVVGLKFGDWLGRQRLRRITYGLLLLIGAAGIASPILSPSVEAKPAQESSVQDPSGKTVDPLTDQGN